MASSKPKTTMNKLNRERKVREKRLDKQARKTRRENEAGDAPAEHADHLQYWLEGTETPAVEETVEPPVGS